MTWGFQEGVANLKTLQTKLHCLIKTWFLIFSPHLGHFRILIEHIYIA